MNARSGDDTGYRSHEGIQIQRRSDQIPDEIPSYKFGTSVFFFEVFVLGGADARGWTKRFAIIVDRQILHVQVHPTGRRLVVDDTV